MHGLYKALQPCLQPCSGAAKRLMPPFEQPFGTLQVCTWSSRQGGQQGPLRACQAAQDGLAGPAQQHQQQRSRAAHVGPRSNIQGVSSRAGHAVATACMSQGPYRPRAVSRPSLTCNIGSSWATSAVPCRPLTVDRWWTPMPCLNSGSPSAASPGRSFPDQRLWIGHLLQHLTAK